MRVNFVCNGDSRTGFGHVARCLQLARLSDSTSGHKQVSFQGSYTDATVRRIREALPRAELRPEEAVVDADVTVFDRLGHPDELNSHAEALIAKVALHTARMIYIASGTAAPALPDAAQCVGYQPGGPAPAPPKLLWGWDYAPVAPELLAHRGCPRDPTRVLVALGGNPDAAPLRLVLSALARFEAIRHIDVLISPVVDVGALHVAAHQSVSRHSNVPSVGPLLARAGLVIASFGNLTYEALALGASVCLLAQKEFQRDLAGAMAELGLAVDAGLVHNLDDGVLANAIARTRALAPTLAQRGPATVDGLGLGRIAELILHSMPAGPARCARSE